MQTETSSRLSPSTPAERTPHATERLATVSLRGTARSAEPRPTTQLLGRTADPLAFGLQVRSTTISRSAVRLRIRASFTTQPQTHFTATRTQGPAAGLQARRVQNLPAQMAA